LQPSTLAVNVALPPGTRIDQYVVGGVLGRGGFGITYLVHDDGLDRDFALKEFFPETLAARSGDNLRFTGRPGSEKDFRWALGKFYEEARLLARLNHPNIVRTIRAFEANNTAYMLQDYIRGHSLEQWLHLLDMTPTQEELDLISTPLLGALDTIHRSRIWHLDISPDNVMIRASDGTPILLDFGAARVEGSDLISVAVFKRGYSAPEQYAAEGSHYCPWTDIYALAATLYRAISGNAPIDPPSRQIRDDLAPTAQVAKGRYRQAFLQAVDWALNIDPEKRPQSIGDWRKALLQASESPNGLEVRVSPSDWNKLLARGATPENKPSESTPVTLAPAAAEATSGMPEARIDDAGQVSQAQSPPSSMSKEPGSLEHQSPQSDVSKKGGHRRDFIDLPQLALGCSYLIIIVGLAYAAYVNSTNTMGPHPDSATTFPPEHRPMPSAVLPQGTRMPSTSVERGDAGPSRKAGSPIKTNPGAQGEGFQECPECPIMIVVPGGEFLMGSPASEDGRFIREGPQHKVTFSKPFAVGKFSVTAGEFAAFVLATKYDIGDNCWVLDHRKWRIARGRSFWDPGFPQQSRHPVVCINWGDAHAYVAWIAGRTGKPYRLLSESEREYVARAGTNTPYWWGHSVTTGQANYDATKTITDEQSEDEYRRGTVPVESFEPNPWGLYNVHGNVWEWVEDCYDGSTYEDGPSDGSSWTGGTCNYRIMRGGSWSLGPRFLRSANRVYYLPTPRYTDNGFRIARTLTDAEIEREKMPRSLTASNSAERPIRESR
jgi:formylglycine-generating enzyme required for sulfatase activity